MCWPATCTETGYLALSLVGTEEEQLVARMGRRSFRELVLLHDARFGADLEDVSFRQHVVAKELPSRAVDVVCSCFVTHRIGPGVGPKPACSWSFEF